VKGSREQPCLHVVFALEEPGRLLLVADTHEDERRLRSWLRRSQVLAMLPALLDRLLDERDERDEKAA
jgi:hypothetical protein